MTVSNQKEKEELYETIAILSKDRQGFKERLNVSEMSLSEVQARLEYWQSIPLDEY